MRRLKIGGLRLTANPGGMGFPLRIQEELCSTEYFLLFSIRKSWQKEGEASVH